MTNKWLQLPITDRQSAILTVAGEHNISPHAVEKDWWVTITLKALMNTSVAAYLLFKGGTSLSKGWNMIQRFSEDIDLSIDRTFFLEILGYNFARCDNNNQIKSLRKASRDFIHGLLSKELENALTALGATDFVVTNLTTRPTKEGPKPIDHDSDPTTIFVDYKSIYPSESADAIERRIKIEISCLSMAEPFELKRISSMISETFPEADDTFCNIRTVTPSRTFLEKILLLNEELQKDKPRTKRMSRHLYDIEKLMDTDYGKAAIENRDLFTTIIEHRRKFYHLGYVDYDKDYPEVIDFCPRGLLLALFAEDYNTSMTHSYIYGTALPFETIMERLRDLQERIRQM